MFSILFQFSPWFHVQSVFHVISSLWSTVICMSLLERYRYSYHQYSLELRVQHLDGTVFPYGVVGLDALSSLEGSRELLNLIPPAQILLTERLHQFSAGQCTVCMNECFYVCLPAEGWSWAAPSEWDRDPSDRSVLTPEGPAGGEGRQQTLFLQERREDLVKGELKFRSEEHCCTEEEVLREVRWM